jgi:hypothetical protein
VEDGERDVDCGVKTGERERTALKKEGRTLAIKSRFNGTKSTLTCFYQGRASCKHVNRVIRGALKAPPPPSLPITDGSFASQQEKQSRRYNTYHDTAVDISQSLECFTCVLYVKIVSAEKSGTEMSFSGRC